MGENYKQFVSCTQDGYIDLTPTILTCKEEEVDVFTKYISENFYHPQEWSYLRQLDKYVLRYIPTRDVLLYHESCNWIFPEENILQILNIWKERLDELENRSIYGIAPKTIMALVRQYIASESQSKKDVLLKQIQDFIDNYPIQHDRLDGFYETLCIKRKRELTSMYYYALENKFPTLTFTNLLQFLRDDSSAMNLINAFDKKREKSTWKSLHNDCSFTSPADPFTSDVLTLEEAQKLSTFDICAICLSDSPVDYCLSCKHFFHESCFLSLKRNCEEYNYELRCPTCRIRISSSEDPKKIKRSWIYIGDGFTKLAPIWHQTDPTHMIVVYPFCENVRILYGNKREMSFQRNSKIPSPIISYLNRNSIL